MVDCKALWNSMQR